MKNLSRFFGCGLPVRLDSNSKRSDSARNEGSIAGSLPSYARASVVDLIGFVFESVAREFHPIGAVSVCLNDISAGLDVFSLYCKHKIAAGEIQLVITAVDVDAALVEHRSHRAVEDINPIIGNCIAKIFHGLFSLITTPRGHSASTLSSIASA